jgi:drug/metabolite transporter (DMT)-like permease
MAGIIFVLSGASPSTATFFRCLYAVPLLWWLMRRERAVFGPRPWRQRGWALAAGVFFAGDLLLFHHSILLIGAGLGTVLVNLQVVFVTLAAWLIWHERPSAAQALAIPLALTGVLLISGVLDSGAYGADPVLGSILAVLTALCYAGYLLILRVGRDRRRAAGPIFDATLACGATALVAGLVVGDIDLLPSMPMHAWLLLLALTAQVGGQVMIAVALPRLPAAVTSLTLLIQPVLATLAAAIILAEQPSTVQLAGVGLILGGVVLGTARGRGSVPPSSAPLASVSA